MKKSFLLNTQGNKAPLLRKLVFYKNYNPLFFDYKKIFLVIFFSLFIILNAFAEKLDLYINKKENYKVNYPPNFEKIEGEQDYDVTFANKLETAFVGIKTEDMKEKVDVLDYMNKFEIELNNMKRKAQRTFLKKELDSIHLDKGIWRSYQSDTLNMVIYVFSKNTKVYVLTEILTRTSIDKKEAELVKKIPFSFRGY